MVKASFTTHNIAIISTVFRVIYAYIYETSYSRNMKTETLRQGHEYFNQWDMCIKSVWKRFIFEALGKDAIKIVSIILLYTGKTQAQCGQVWHAWADMSICQYSYGSQMVTFYRYQQRCGVSGSFPLSPWMLCCIYMNTLTHMCLHVRTALCPIRTVHNLPHPSRSATLALSLPP